MGLFFSFFPLYLAFFSLDDVWLLMLVKVYSLGRLGDNQPPLPLPVAACVFNLFIFFSPPPTS